jgi:hypothetical protein
MISTRTLKTIPTHAGGLMKSRRSNRPTVLVCILIFAVTQVYLGMAFAAPAGASSRVTTPQAVSGILTTQGNKPITVNGASATTGATILTGAVIETPDGVTATINIPGHGSVSIAANSRLTISLDPTGNILINLAAGCVVLHTTKGTTGEIDNPQGVVGRTDASKDGRIDTCTTRAAGAAAPGGGLSTGAIVAIAAAVGGGVGLAFALRGSNPSPSRP